MSEAMKMLEGHAQEFLKVSPLLELEVPVSSVYPAVVALVIEKHMAEKGVEAAEKGAKSWNETKTYAAKSGRKQDGMKKPEGQEVAKSDRETTTYCLVYFNPETRKAEVVEGSVSLEYEDETEQAIEEGLAQRSTYGMYANVATPMIREHVDEQLLREIMERIKIESPGIFGPGAPVRISEASASPKIIEEYGDAIVAIEVAERRKLGIEERLSRHIVAVDSAVKKLELGHEDVMKVVEVLPPLSRERVVALVRKRKRVSKKTIRELLEKDLFFLSAVKEKFRAMRPEDILKILKRMKQEKELEK